MIEVSGRIILVGDLHLDCVIGGFDYHQEVLRRLDEVRAHVKSGDTVVQMGDASDPDRSALTVRALAAFATWARSLPPDVQTWVVSGNHDVLDHAFARSAIGLLHDGERICVVDRPQEMALAHGSLAFAGGPRIVMLPWMSRAHGPVDVEGAAAEVIGEDPRPVIVLCHLDLPGVGPSGEAEMPRLGQLFLPQSVIDDPRVVAVYGGHIHKPGTYGKVTVVGSLARLGFGEAEDEKRFVILSADGGVQSVPVGVLPHVTVRLRVRAGEEPSPVGDPVAVPIGAVVRFEVTADEGAEVPVAKMRAWAEERGAAHVAPIAPSFARGELPRREVAPVSSDPAEALMAYAATNPAPPATDPRKLLEEVV